MTLVRIAGAARAAPYRIILLQKGFGTLASLTLDDQSASIRTSVSGAVLTITICRPHRRNAIDKPTANALLKAFKDFDADPALSVAVLAGSGGHFCSGADLAALSDPSLRNDVDEHGKGAGPLGPTRLALQKPTIAAVEGFAVAGGLELALICDLRVVGKSAVFGVFCRRWGVPLIDGGTVRLPRIIGHGRAMDMIITGRAVGAAEALSWGLATCVVPDGSALEKAHLLAAQVAAFPQACLRADRASALAQWSLSEADALRAEGAGGAAVLPDAAAGVASFVAGAGRGGR